MNYWKLTTGNRKLKTDSHKSEVRKITYEKINFFLQNEPKSRKSQMNITGMV